MSLYSIAPFDQNLSLNGSYLTDSTKTLAELRVFPKSTIYLTADDPGEAAGESTAWPEQDPEQGFKGEFP